jgi:kynurenine formamidase
MTISIEINGQTETVDINNPIDISISLQFNGPQPNAYGVEKASSKACEAEDIIGDTRRGGSCNFEQVTLIPHCNGTHTECVGHITHERVSVNTCLKDVFIPATLISVKPEKVSESKETYSVDLRENDQMITKHVLESGLPTNLSLLDSALIIRTLPNDDSKLIREYIDTVPPFFSTDAIEYVAGLGVKHLLVDLPSIDRLYDEGKLSNHRIFWNVKQGSFETNPATRINNTVTELIYVPNEIEDGLYILNLQIAPFASDAAPSRPILFKIKP